ncbi:MAG: hypothetical protein NC120_00585 [Ruminococcus sp.]|nr:hypothetical protein [Ruminococcus sp.]
MKMKKTFASVAAVAMAASMASAFSITASAIAEGTAIDFEDGDCSFIYMNVDDSGADNSTFSVADFNGSKQLKVDVTTASKTPKVWFDLDKITDRANTVQINTIEMDLTFEPKDPEKALGWIGGQIGAAGGFDMDAAGKGQVNPSWSSTDWQNEDDAAYTEGGTPTVHVTKKFLLPSTKYSEEGINPFFGIMAWGNGDTSDYYMYVDNIVLKDKNGNALPVGVFAAAEEAEAEGDLEEGTEAEAPVEETAETAAEETAAVPVEEVTEAPAVVGTAAVDYSALTGDVISDTAATSGGEWGQALTLTTVKNENGVFDPAMLTADKAVVVYYEADTAPEVVLQSWSGGEGWAKVPANEALSTAGVAVYTYEDMTAMYQADNFTETLDSFIVGDTGSALTVNKVMLVDAASLTEGAAPAVDVIEEAAPAVVEEAAAETVPVETAAPVQTATTPVAPTGNTSAAAVMAVMAVAGVGAVASRKRK